MNTAELPVAIIIIVLMNGIRGSIFIISIITPMTHSFILRSAFLTVLPPSPIMRSATPNTRPSSMICGIWPSANGVMKSLGRMPSRTFPIAGRSMLVFPFPNTGKNAAATAIVSRATQRLTSTNLFRITLPTLVSSSMLPRELTDSIMNRKNTGPIMPISRLMSADMTGAAIPSSTTPLMS